MHRIPKGRIESFGGQYQIYKTLDDFCNGHENVRSFYVEDYDDCWQTLREMAHDYYSSFNQNSNLYRWGLMYPEIISDDPRKYLHVWLFPTEIGQKFMNCIEGGAMFDFEREEPDFEESIKTYERALASDEIPLGIIHHIENIRYPELQEVKRLLVLKKLSGHIQNGYLIPA